VTRPLAAEALLVGIVLAMFLQAFAGDEELAELVIADDDSFSELTSASKAFSACRSRDVEAMLSLH
jgi:hypothetical protein